MFIDWSISASTVTATALVASLKVTVTDLLSDATTEVAFAPSAVTIYVLKGNPEAASKTNSAVESLSTVVGLSLSAVQFPNVQVIL